VSVGLLKFSFLRLANSIVCDVRGLSCLTDKYCMTNHDFKVCDESQFFFQLKFSLCAENHRVWIVVKNQNILLCINQRSELVMCNTKL
jgi:hypothetical protein